MLTPDERLALVIEKIEELGFDGVGGFMAAFLSTNDGGLKRRAQHFTQHIDDVLIEPLFHHARHSKSKLSAAAKEVIMERTTKILT
jgi:sugar phosphate isomerase/epimerase